jgi:hypothetical protein
MRILTLADLSLATGGACGANAPGGGGFTKGNTCAKGGTRTTSKQSKRRNRYKELGDKLDWFHSGFDYKASIEIDGRKFKAFLIENAQNGDETKITNVLHKLGLPSAEFVFGDQGGQVHVTGKGSAHKVMRHMAGAVYDSLTDLEQPSVFFTSGDKKSRTDLYRFMTSRAPKMFPNHVGIAQVYHDGKLGEFAIVNRDRFTDEMRKQLLTLEGVEIYEADDAN